MHVAQQLAAEAVEQVLAGRNLGVSLERIFQRHANLSQQRHGLTQDLSYGSLRYYGQLQALLDRLLEKPLSDQRLHCLLLVALYQLAHAQAAPHTVVDQAVKAAASFRQRWARGLVNAVLRNFLRQQQTLVEQIAENEVAHYSYPQWWIDRLKLEYPQHWSGMLQAGNQHPPMTLRVNRRRAVPADYLAKLADAGIAAHALHGSAVMLDKPLPVDKIPGFRQGEVSVQDYGAQFAAELLDVADGMRVLDACCAPGGKTGHLLELADIDLLALDSDEGRLQRVRDNLARLGLQAPLRAGDAAEPAGWWDSRPFDRILADVPCTASGIVRRHVDIKWLRREADIAAFAEQQARILPRLWQLLAKGGKLLYVTCSVFHEENQRQIERFLRIQPDAVRLQLTHPGLMDTPDGQLRPCAEHDGFFYALLQKK